MEVIVVLEGPSYILVSLSGTLNNGVSEYLGVYIKILSHVRLSPPNAAFSGSRDGGTGCASSACLEQAVAKERDQQPSPQPKP